MTRVGSGKPWSALGLAVGLLASVACSATRGTERVFNGQTVHGPYIEAEAYAAYAEGAYREARGDWAGAEQAYRRALLRDGQSPQILTRLGAMACRQSLARALRYFERASALEDYAPAWSERAECLSKQHQPPAALQAALRAVALDAEGAQPNLLLARLYREQAHPELARAWLFGWLLLEPAVGSWAAELRREADLLGDPPLSTLVQRRLESRRASAARHLVAALRAGELERARELATEASIPPLELSLLATTNAKPDLGLAQADLLLAANPKDSAALVGGLLAAARLNDDAAFRRLLRDTHAEARPPLELADRFTELLRSRVGDEAADSWREAYLNNVAPRAPKP